MPGQYSAIQVMKYKKKTTKLSQIGGTKENYNKIQCGSQARILEQEGTLLDKLAKSE